MRFRPSRSLAVSLTVALAAMSPGVVMAQDSPDPSAPDYRQPAYWLCHPDIERDSCDVDLTATVIPADGRLDQERFTPAEAPTVDCFYVYPTVSTDPTWLSDFQADAGEREAVRIQFARFGAACRLFAPLYRQGTLRRLRVAMGGPAPEGEQPPPRVGGYADVQAAWRWYMDNENGGRGVVLIGHSQGGAMVSRLVAEEIDGKPEQARLVAAYVLGAPVMVPADADVGGSFRAVPLCRSGDQVGCVVSYATFRDRFPPPEGSRFGLARDGLRVACVNPADLAGQDGRPRPYFLTRGSLNGSSGPVQPEWTRPPQPIETPFVTTPGLISTRCVRQGDYDYLEMGVEADPDDPRTDEVFGEIIRASGPDYGWGLHNIDMDHSMGTLVDLVTRQTAAWRASRP